MRCSRAPRSSPRRARLAPTALRGAAWGIALVAASLSLACSKACDDDDDEPRDAVASVFRGDVEGIRSRGVIRLLVYGAEAELLSRRGSPTSLERSLAEDFARSLGVRVDLVRVPAFSDLIPALLEGRGDLIAASLAVTEARAAQIAFTRPVRVVDEVLVARKGAEGLPSTLAELRGQRVTVRRSSSYAESLAALEGVKVAFADEHLEDEQLVHRVGQGEIAFTVVDSDLLADIQAYDDDVQGLLTVRARRSIALGVRPTNAGLRQRADAFLVERALTARSRTPFRGDLEGIRERGVLRVLTRNHAASYFLHKGRPMGFDFELARQMAKELGVRLEVVVPPRAKDLIPWLLEGRGDVVAAAFTNTEARARRVAFSAPYLWVDEVLVARAGRPTPRSLEELAGVSVSVRPSSSYARTLRELQRRVPLTVVDAPPQLATEELIARVGEGEIPFTVADQHILDVELAYRDDVVAALPLTKAAEGATDAIGKPVPGAKPIAFAVRPDSKALRSWLDGFVQRTYRGTLWGVLHRRYFEDERTIHVAKEESLRASGELSPYDALFRRLAARYALDWRLVAAQAYQESRFDVAAESWAGAQGLLQVMPATAEELGLRAGDLEESTHAGVRYLAQMIDAFEEELPLAERVRFGLASYNVGRGHVLDARRLAKELGKDPDVWFGHVEVAMRKLQVPRYARRARHGWCRGEEPVRYVTEIQARYEQWTALIDAAP